MVDYSTTALISSIQTRIMLPSKQNTLTSTAILQLANEELQTAILPLIMSLQWEFFVTYVDYTLTSSRECTIPSTAIASKLREVVVVDSSNNEEVLPLITLDNYTEGNPWQWATKGFYIRGNKIVVSPNISVGETIRMYYFRRPNSLVTTTNAGQILSIDTDTGVVILDNVPAAWDTDDTICVVSNTPAFELVVESRTMTDVSSPTITVADTSDLVVGDWVALEGHSPIPQIPVEAHPVLAQAVAVKCLEALGDVSQIPVSQQKFIEIMTNYRNMTAPRVEGASKRIFSNRNIINYATSRNNLP